MLNSQYSQIKRGVRMHVGSILLIWPLILAKLEVTFFIKKRIF